MLATGRLLPSEHLRGQRSRSPSNIAKSQGRAQSPGEFVHFLSLASGSLAELETQLLPSVDLGYLQSMEAAPTAAQIAEIQKMVAAIQRKLAIKMQ